MDPPAKPSGPNEHARERRRFALLDAGFRPFFLLAGLHAVVAIPWWLAVLHGSGSAPLPGLAWHAHEMLYGFVMAAMAGFLLTAVPSWTAQPGLARAPLLALALVWLAGRVLVSLPLGLPSVVIALADLAFVPALVVAILPPLVRSANRRNLVFVAFLALLFAANLWFHLAGAVSTGALTLALDALVLMVALLGGRIVPAFTGAALKRRGYDAGIRPQRLVDPAALVATAAVLVADLVVPGTFVAGLVTAVAALLLALRLARWHGHRTLAEPIVWVLHLGYAWLPVGLALKAASLLGAPVPTASGLHALTVGAFSTMILGVMSRAALGHTGRALAAPRPIALAYLLLSAAALARVCGPMLAAPALWLDAAAMLWTAAFGLFVVVYAPILVGPRADESPGRAPHPPAKP